jgi:transcriptional regulator with XRE-family HTH domain
MAEHAGELLRGWRQRRRLSQLDLAIAANISSRHLSFVETGRSRPTSEMILRLAEQLEVPLRERNALLLAGGYAPAYPERALAGPELHAVQAALKRVLASHEPYPAAVVNRCWELVDANAGIALFTRHVKAALLEPPANVLRLSLHPDGMAPRIANLPQWRAHLLARLSRQVEATGDPRLAELHEELAAYPGGESHRPIAAEGSGGLGPAAAGGKAGSVVPPGASRAEDVVVPLRYRADDQELSFLSITALIGTPMDITVEELAIESFYPADAPTAAALRS